MYHLYNTGDTNNHTSINDDNNDNNNNHHDDNDNDNDDDGAIFARPQMMNGLGGLCICTMISDTGQNSCFSKIRY